MPDLLDLQEFDEEALKKESEEVLEMRFLTGENAVFARTKGGFLSLKTGEKEYERVGVYLTFPLTNPEEYISIREADEKAKEIGLIQNLKDLKKEEQEIAFPILSFGGKELKQSSPFFLVLENKGKGKAKISVKCSLKVCLPCDRCLAPVEVPLVLNFEREVYAPDAEMSEEEREEQQFMKVFGTG